MIHVVTTVHNRYPITEKFVESLCRQDCEVHLILVDDGSTDGTDQMVRRKMPTSTVLYGNGNLWWAGGLQKAFDWLREHAADEDAVMISNDDTVLPAGHVAAGAALLTGERLVVSPGYGAKSGELLDGLFWHSFADGTGRLLPPGSEGNCASSRNLFLTVGQWKKIGGFHPFLLPQYFSDFEFTIRAYRKGFRLECFEELAYRFDEEATGHNSYSGLTWKKLFSKRSGLNPFYRLNFILLSTPPRYLPAHLLHQRKRYGKRLSRMAGRGR